MEASTATATPDLETVTQRVTEANERLVDAGRKITAAYLDGIEKYVAGLAQFERKIAEQSQVEAISTLLETHAKVTEEVVTASVSAARQLVSA
jgi:hypothetical protein